MSYTVNFSGDFFFGNGGLYNGNFKSLVVFNCANGLYVHIGLHNDVAVLFGGYEIKIGAGNDFTSGSGKNFFITGCDECVYSILHKYVTVHLLDDGTGGFSASETGNVELGGILFECFLFFFFDGSGVE